MRYKSLYALNRSLNILFNENYKEDDEDNKDVNVIHELYKRL